MAVTMPVSGAFGDEARRAGQNAEHPLTLGGYVLPASDPAAARRRGVTLPASILLHSTAALALVVVPLLMTDAIPEPQSGVRAFLVEPISAPPPPPPPAARSAAAPRVAPKAQPQTQAFVAPIEVPTEIKPEEALDLGGLDAGTPGGVEGGIPGGVVGGIVGGLPDAPPPPVAAVRVGGNIREPRRLVAVPPVYPELALAARLQGNVVVEATIDERGRVVSTNLLSGAPLLSDAAIQAVKKWVYTPTLLNGVPTPVIMVVTVRFKLGKNA